MREIARIPLPRHPPDGEFDHAAVARSSDRLYVAHPSTDAVEVVDLGARQHVRSLEGLPGVAGVWVDDADHLLFTSNRGEDTASIFRLDRSGEKELHRVPTGSRPNGMAYDARRRILMVAGVGRSDDARAPPTLTFVEATAGKVLGTVRMPGRTRWGLYHPPTDAFYVNVADPPSVVQVAADDLSRVARSFAVPARGPHGLEQDPEGGLLYCACDDGVLLSLDVHSGTVATLGALSGPPDVLWLNLRRRRLYVAIGEPGVVDVFDVPSQGPATRATTALGAHTLTVDPTRDEVHVFLPESHEDLVLEDGPPSP